MKKIWPWLLLLLLLIIFCVWSKKDTIHLHSDNQAHTVATTHVANEVHPIEYIIRKEQSNYTLNGNFTNTQQQDSFAQSIKSANGILRVENTATNQTLQGDDAIALTNKILPLFVKTYENGKITYHNQTLTIDGIASSYEAQHDMQALLNTSTMHTQDNSTVAKPKPIHYTIEKNLDALHVAGTLKSTEEVVALQAKLPSNATSKLDVDANIQDQKGSLSAVKGFLPFFLEKYTHGKIDYSDEQLTVTGMVHSQAEVDAAKQKLASTHLALNNHTQVDPQILAELAAKKKAEEAVKQAQLETERKAQEAQLANNTQSASGDTEANPAAMAGQNAQAKDTAQQVALEAERKAQAQREAQLEADRKAQAQKQAALEAEKQAQLAKATKEAELKAKIKNLFRLENIEFNVNKSTLTAKGQNTVNKLASILKEYTSVNIEIAGHTDSDGSAQYNQKLSQSRVDMVKTKLIAQQISASRLTAKGYGESQPLVPNTTRENKARNRRVEINILGE